MPEDLSRRLGLAVPALAWLADPLPDVVADALRRLARAPGIARLAIMPDVHLAEAVCVGVVLATRGIIYPQAIGADIGCGITAVPLDAEVGVLAGADAREAALAALQAAIPIIRWPRGMGPELLAEIRDGPSSGRARGMMAREGALQFGTLGRGNHFAEIQIAEDGRLWLTVHSGSRAMGPEVMQHAMNAASRAGGGLRYLDAASAEGTRYLVEAAWCVRYAAANRLAMLERAAAMLREALGVKARLEEALGTSHNFVEWEQHGGEELLVHRKGASPAREGQASIIPGSMGGETFHVVGRGEAASLRSSSHGAGRRLSRTDARRFFSTADFRRQASGVCYDARLVRSLCEEAPDAYRDIQRVMRAQTDLVTITRRLRAVVCHKGG